MIYDIGDKVTVTTTVLVANVATDATMAILVTAPDLTTSVPAITHPGVGQYAADITPTQVGTYLVHWTASGAAVGVDEYQFTVQPPGFRIVSLTDVKLHLNKVLTATTDDNELRAFIDGAGLVVDAVCGPTVNRTVVEYHDGGRVAIPLRIWPMVSVTSVVETWWGGTNYTLTRETDLGVGPSTGFDYTADIAQGLIYRRISFFPADFVPGVRNIKVTYVAGRPHPWPTNITLAAKELVGFMWRTSQLGRGPTRATIGGQDTQMVAGYAVPNPIVDMLMTPDKLPPMVGTG